MAYTQTATSSALLDTVRGNNTLVNDLAKRRLYDTAVDEFNARDRRPKVNFSKVVSEEQTLIATRAYPEFQITFYNTQNAVHSLAGGLRSLELEYLMMQIPYGSLTYDIGGNFASHLFKGRAYVHCCMPNLDVRDIMRHEGQKDSVELYLARLERGNKFVPNFQKEAFDRYAETPDEVVCHDTFQTCRHSQEMYTGRVYAIALHSIYDIPADEFGAALLRKNVHVCYAAFHFSENLLLEDSHVNLDEINACFQRDGDRLTFSFASESTLNYTHSFSNILKYVCKTYFPASNREVYMKEFLVTRVNTWFCKFSRIDTFLLYKGVAHKGVDSEQFYKAMEDAWHYKKTLAMCNSERILLEDSSSVNYWFPKMRDMVIVPLLTLSETSKRSRKEVLVSKDLVYTVLNHIRTYQAKALTYANVLSFVESIRSRVIINGVTARSEWDVDKSLLQSLSMTFFLHTKLSVLKDDLLISKFSLGPKPVSQLMWEEISLAFGNAFPTIKERLINRKLIQITENALEIRVPDLYVTFHDRLVSEYKLSVEMPALDIRKKMEETEVMYNALSELSVLKNSDKFDVDVFSQMCQSLEVDPMTAAKVIVAVMSNESGLTLTFEQPTEANVALALQDSEKASEGALVVTSRDVEEPSMKGSMARGELQLAGLAGDIPESSFTRSEEIESLEQFHMATASSLIQKQMCSIVYTGTIKVQQMKNFIDSLVASLSAAVSNLVKILKDTAANDLESRQKFGVLHVTSKKCLDSNHPPQSHAWGALETHARKYHVALLEYDESGVITCDDWRRVAVSSESVVYSDMAKLKTLRKLLLDGEPPVSSAKVVLVDGVPGCGKTKQTLSKVNFDEDLILVPGRQAAEMIRRRANSSGVIVATKDNVRTVDSFIMNYGKGGRCQFKRLFIDEGLMLHTGCVNFLVTMSLCDIAYVYGDTQQIPYINRVTGFPYPAHFSKLEVDEVETRRTTLRCPADVTHFLNQRYEGYVMCTSAEKKSVSQEMVSGAATINPVSKPLSGKVLTFTQSDKEALLSRGYSDVHTVHEVQGETYADVSLVRLTPTPVSIMARTVPMCLSHCRVTQNRLSTTRCHGSLVSIIREIEQVSSYLLDMYKVEAGTQ
nr:126 kDa protein [Tomato mottle mosaic virus]